MSFSLQRALGRPEEFFGLLESSAQECCNALHALEKMASPDGLGSLDGFISARRKDKEITARLEYMLTHVFVTPMEREDLEALAQCLYVIPKTVEKFAERYAIVRAQLRDVDFSTHAAVLFRAAAKVLEMVQALRRYGTLSSIKDLNRDLQQIEYLADDQLYSGLRRLYSPGFPPFEGIILKDLYDILDAVMDQCRTTGDTIAHIVLKNS